jgi:hypothetical protein
MEEAPGLVELPPAVPGAGGAAAEPETVCAVCGFVAKTPAGLSAHRRTHTRRRARG